MLRLHMVFHAFQVSFPKSEKSTSFNTMEGYRSEIEGRIELRRSPRDQGKSLRRHTVVLQVFMTML